MSGERERLINELVLLNAKHLMMVELNHLNVIADFILADRKRMLEELLPVMKELADNCKASTVEEDISEDRRRYRQELYTRSISKIQELKGTK